MCECATCGAVAACGDPGCTNDECPACAEALERAGADPEPEPIDPDVAADPRRI